MSSSRQRAHAHSGERKAKVIPGAGVDAEPSELVHWCGWNLAAAVDDGRELLVATDGRCAALVPRKTQAMAGDAVRPRGVTQSLRLASLLGTHATFELWLLSNPAECNERWLVTGRRR